jgi:hypothetical protein
MAGAVCGGAPRRFVELGPKRCWPNGLQNLEGKDDIIARVAGNMDDGGGNCRRPLPRNTGTAGASIGVTGPIAFSNRPLPCSNEALSRLSPGSIAACGGLLRHWQHLKAASSPRKSLRTAEVGQVRPSRASCSYSGQRGNNSPAAPPATSHPKGMASLSSLARAAHGKACLHIRPRAGASPPCPSSMMERRRSGACEKRRSSPPAGPWPAPAPSR